MCSDSESEKYARTCKNQAATFSFDLCFQIMPSKLVVRGLGNLGYVKYD